MPISKRPPPGEMRRRYVTLVQTATVRHRYGGGEDFFGSRIPIINFTLFPGDSCPGKNFGADLFLKTNYPQRTNHTLDPDPSSIENQDFRTNYQSRFVNYNAIRANAGFLFNPLMGSELLPQDYELTFRLAKKGNPDKLHKRIGDFLAERIEQLKANPHFLVVLYSLVPLWAYPGIVEEDSTFNKNRSEADDLVLATEIEINRGLRQEDLAISWEKIMQGLETLLSPIFGEEFGQLATKARFQSVPDMPIKVDTLFDDLYFSANCIPRGDSELRLAKNPKGELLFYCIRKGIVYRNQNLAEYLAKVLQIDPQNLQPACGTKNPNFVAKGLSQEDFRGRLNDLLVQLPFVDPNDFD